MENYYSSYPESGDSSPLSREIECETAAVASGAAVWADDVPPPPSRVKLMCSYGGRIQPRHHDNQLTYVGGDTKILAVDRYIRFPVIIAKLAALSGADDVVLKYQLPGEDLDALISVTNDEDLDHMMVEYDRLYRIRLKPVPRLRLFLFAAIGSKNSQDRAVFADPLPSSVTMAAVPATESPDYLFGLDAPKLSPTDVPVKGPAVETAGTESATAEAMISPTEMQRLEISGGQQQIPQVSSDETLARVYPPEYYAPLIQENAAPPPLPPAYWQEQQRSVVPPQARFASFVGGDGNLYVFPTGHGVFPANPGYYAAFPGVVTPTAFSVGAQQGKTPATAYDSAAARVQDNMAGYAYDSAGRAVYYAAGAAATYQTVGSNVAMAAESLKPSQVS